MHPFKSDEADDDDDAEVMIPIRRQHKKVHKRSTALEQSEKIMVGLRMFNGINFNLNSDVDPNALMLGLHEISNYSCMSVAKALVNLSIWLMR